MVLARRIAIISDIHGNLPALNAVLHDIEQCDVAEIIVAGDMVGRGPLGSEVVSKLRSVTDCFIGGNHEDYLTNFRQRDGSVEWMEAPEWAILRWMADQLSDDNAAFIADLPFSTTSKVIPNLRVVHGSPNSNNEGIGPWTPTEKLREHLNSIEETLLVCAHTHRPLKVDLDIGSIVNIGAVGLPFNGDQRAQYALFDYNPSSGDVTVTFRQVAYDVQETLRDYETSGFLDAGGVSAQLLAVELREATPALVPYQSWLREQLLEEGEESLRQFLKLRYQ